jgi:transcriptional regulator with XRE-family HTH domain
MNVRGGDAMNYEILRREILTAIRAERTQGQLNQKLGFSFNKVYRWESGRAQIGWDEFILVCEICRVDLAKAMGTCFSYFEDMRDHRRVMKHFIGKNKITDIAKATGISRHSLSRSLNGAQVPTLEHMFVLIDHSSADFLRFIEQIANGKELPFVREKLEFYRKQLEVYYENPWLSALLSAIDLEEYQTNPSEDFLARKSRLPVEIVRKTIGDLSRESLLHWNGQGWETRFQRIGVRTTPETKQKIAKYVYRQAFEAVDTSINSPQMRFSWKLFSLNQKSYEKILQKYTEFFNELGTIIDEGQKGADKVYLFSVGLLDYDELAEYKPELET